MKSVKCLACAVGALLVLAGSAAHALVIGFSPTNQAKATGEIAAVDLVMSGLANAGEIVSGFSVNVTFDGAPPVAFVSGSYSGALGDPLDLLQTLNFPIAAAGNVIDLLNLSLLTDAELDALQDDTVVLATLRFQSNVAASTTLSVSYPLNGITGRQVPGTTNLPEAGVLMPDPATATITWRGDVQQVPVPGTLLLLAAPLVWLMRRRD